MQVVSIINYKGGVGKTSLTANLAGELAFRGYNVLMIDMDPQASLTFSFVKPDYWEKVLAPNRTVKAWYDAQSSSNASSLVDLIVSPSTVRGHLAGKDAGRLD